MNKKYNLKLDLQFRCNNSTMKFNQFDNNTSDFFIRITNGGNLVDVEKAIVVLATIKPSGKVASQFVEIENGLVYADLKPNMKDEIGTYTAQAMLILEDKRVVTDVISYEVEEDKIFSLLNDTVETTEEFTLLTDMLSRLSNIEISEEQRVINEAERILSEENRKIEEAKRVEAELARQHEEADRAKYDATRESNENIRKQNESIRLANTEQARVSAENTRVSNENTREASEVTRQNNENQRVEAETQRQNRYNSFILEAEANANNFENYTNTAKVKEEERKSNELDRKSQEARRVSNEVERISNENTRKANEVAREKNETSRQYVFENKVDEIDTKISELNTTKDNFVSSINTEVDTKISELDTAKADMTTTVSNKIQEVETRFNALTSSQQQDAEVIDARDGETSLKARLDRDMEKATKELDKIKKLEESTVSTVTTESDFTTVEATSNGYFEDVKLEGKTLVNLAKQPTNNGSINHQYATISTVTNIKPSTEYTYIIRNNGSETLKLYLNNNGGFDWRDLDVGVNSTVIGKAKTLPTIEGDIWLSLREAETIEQNLQVVLLEGDHTQNPPSYFEGLMSVGQDVDKVSVESTNQLWNNLKLFKSASDFDITVNKLYSNGFDINANTYNVNSALYYNTYLKKDETYTIELKGIENIANVRLYPSLADIKNNINHISIVNGIDKADYVVSFTPTHDNMLLRFWVHNSSNKKAKVESISIYKENQHIPHQSDKKRLLYYNNETQAWEKPILREWDSIEKHANGKYYYHQRSGEVVLNGSENWSLNAGWSGEEMSTSSYYLTTDDQKTAGLMVKSKGATNIISEVMPTVFINNTSFDSDCVSGENHTGAIYIRINKSKVSNGIKPYLQQNPMRVVYQLAQEKVYECTNIDLITYANETNYVVESGAIVPKTTLKVHNNISNVVSLLQKKVSLLESNITNYMITQNRMQLASTYSADSVTFKVDYFSLCGDEENYDEDLYNLILNNILVGKDNYDYDKMFTMILDYASWNQISWEQFDILVGLMDIQHNPPVEEIPTEDEVIEETPNEIM